MLVLVPVDINKRKEQFNVAYIDAIAAKVGLKHLRADVDDDSVDVTLEGRNYTGKLRNPQIQLQLKCTSRSVVSISDNCIKFSLKKKNYDDLRADNVLSPRYLVVMIVPEDISNWVIHHEDCMALHHSCYWISIKNHPDSDNTSTITINVPLTQKLTSEKLALLMQAASNGESV